MAVGLSANKAQEYLAKVRSSFSRFGLTVSCINSPTSVTISGEENQVDSLKSFLQEDGIFARKLQVNVAYHSPQMEEVAEKYLALIGKLKMNNSNTSVKMISSVLGRLVTNEELCQASYWVKNMVSPVRFMEALQYLCSQSRAKLTKKLDGSHRKAVVVEHLIEVGPHPALQRAIRDTMEGIPRGKSIGYDSVLRHSTSASKTMLELVGNLFALGVNVNLRRANDPELVSTPSRITLADLPEYPFDHEQSYWYESRISKSHRLRSHGPNELLGTPSQDWNPLDGRWRYVIKAADLPWIESHKVNNTVVYPGAGIVVMAIEAVYQMIDPQRYVVGYELRDIVFQAALDISSSPEGLETQFSLRTLKDAQDTDDACYEFTVFSFTANAWNENCHGAIKIQYESSEAMDDKGAQAETLAYYQRMWQTKTETCTEPVDCQNMYEFLDRCGLSYGLPFQAIKTSAYSSGQETVAEIQLSELPSGNTYPQHHVIHPTTLDAVAHLMFTALSKGGTKKMSTHIPTSISRLWVSSTGFNTADDSLSVSAKITTETPRNAKASFLAFSKDKKSLRIVIEDLETSVVATTPTSAETSTEEPQVWCHIDTKVDIDMLSPAEIVGWLDNAYVRTAPEPVEFHRDLTKLLYQFLLRVKNDIDATGLIITDSHLQNYVKWIKYQLEKSDCADTDLQQTQSIETSATRIKDQGAMGNLFVEVGNNIQSILRGDVDAVQLLFENDLVGNYYEEESKSSNCFPKCRKYVDVLAHKNPGMKILEVGAGTGAATEHILDTLSRHADGEIGALRYKQYDFTDISPSFFEKAGDFFSEHQHKMKFGVLDIEKAPADQGYEEKTYDLLIAASVLHVTKNLSTTLQNMRKLLKPNGKLIIHEPTTPCNIKTGFVFGLLPGWWLGTEDNRILSPALTEENWNDLLKSSGFSGVDFVLRDYQDDLCHQTSVLVTTAKDESKHPSPIPDTLIIVEEGATVQKSIAEKLKSGLVSYGQSTSRIISVHEAALSPDLGKFLIIFLVESEQPFLQHLEETSYMALKSTLISARNVLWITAGGGLSGGNPGFGIIDGFARALRLEMNNLKLVTLALEDNQGDQDRYVEAIIRVTNESFTESCGESYEREYTEIGGMLHLKRIVEANYLKSSIAEKLASRRSTVQRLGDSELLELDILTIGQLETLEYVPDESAQEELQANEVEIQVKAIGLNSMDYFMTEGKESKMGFGSECAGNICRVGRESSLKPGDRVCMYGRNVFKTLARSTQDLIAKIPDDLDFDEAATLPRGLLIASYMINKVARLQKGESVLIHEASGSIGKAAIRLAQLIGADVYATASTKEDMRELVELHNLFAEHVLSNSSFSVQVKDITDGRGVDVILSNTKNQGFLDSWDCIAPFGRLLLIKQSDGSASRVLPLNNIPSNVTLTQVDPESVLRARPSQIHTSLQSIANFGAIKTSQTQIFPYKASEVQQAFEKLREIDHKGRVVVRVDENYEVAVSFLTQISNYCHKPLISLDPQVTTAVKPTYSFPSNATYLISGGLGGVGRTIARWMVSRGSKNLILLSRSGPRTDAARDMLAEMRENGVCVEVPSCDVTDHYALQTTIAECSEKMPPIKGCVQGSMVLNVRFYSTLHMCITLLMII